MIRKLKCWLGLHQPEIIKRHNSLEARYRYFQFCGCFMDIYEKIKSCKHCGRRL